MNKLVNFVKLLLQSCKSIIKLFIYKSFFSEIKSEKVLDDKVFILGNGPSLKENLINDMELLKKSDTFCVNTFCFSEQFCEIKPKYYIFLDPAYFMEDVASKFKKMQKEIIEVFKTLVTWDLILFIPKKTDMKDDWGILETENKNIKIVYFNNNAANGFDKIIFCLFNKNLAMPEPQNVLIGAIFLSINLGYKNIYLLGSDHSWTEDLRVNDENQLYIIDKHFNSIEEKLFYKYNGKDIWSMGDLLYALSKTFKAYYVLQKYARYKKVKILNLTSKSFIDAFDRNFFKETFYD